MKDNEQYCVALKKPIAFKWSDFTYEENPIGNGTYFRRATHVTRDGYEYDTCRILSEEQYKTWSRKRR